MKYIVSLIIGILAGAAILYRPSRLVGAVSAFGLMTGAIGFHLSPWLGTSIPTQVTSNWKISSFLFMAVESIVA